jgi:hypothetical protein
MTNRQDFPKPPIKIALFTFLALFVVSILICWLTGFVSYRAIGLCLMGSGIIALLFAAYGFMGETAMDCDDRVRFSGSETPVIDQTAAAATRYSCVNHLALGIGGGGVLTIFAGVLVYMLAG